MADRLKLQEHIRALEEALTLSEVLRVEAEEKAKRIEDEMGELYVVVNLDDENNIEVDFTGRPAKAFLSPNNYGFLQKRHYDIQTAVL